MSIIWNKEEGQERLDELFRKEKELALYKKAYDLIAKDFSKLVKKRTPDSFLGKEACKIGYLTKAAPEKEDG